MQPAVFFWLRELLKQHWQVVLVQGSKQDFSTLSALKQLLHRKAQNMQTLLMLKGKIEMVAAMSLSVEEPEESKQGDYLTYKDFDSEDGDDQSMGESGESDEEDE